jgi:hypothetical protein
MRRGVRWLRTPEARWSSSSSERVRCERVRVRRGYAQAVSRHDPDCDTQAFARLAQAVVQLADLAGRPRRRDAHDQNLARLENRHVVTCQSTQLGAGHSRASSSSSTSLRTASARTTGHAGSPAGHCSRYDAACVGDRFGCSGCFDVPWSEARCAPSGRPTAPVETNEIFDELFDRPEVPSASHGVGAKRRRS